MWLGDSPTEIGTGLAPCSVDDAGTEFTCTDSDDESPFGGSIELSAAELTLSLADCSGDPGECQASYARDPSVRCDD